MTEEQISEAMYNVLDSYTFEISFNPGLKTLLKITAAAAVGNVIALATITYVAKKLHKEEVEKIVNDDV